jgi:signal transduction histidine kinase
MTAGLTCLKCNRISGVERACGRRSPADPAPTREEAFMSTPVVGRRGGERQSPARWGRRGQAPPASDPGAAILELERERAHRRALEKQVAVLFQRRAEIQEEERRRISRDIHDHVGQQMTSLRMQLELLSKRCQGYPPLLEQVEKTQRVAQALDGELDSLVAELRPAVLPPAEFAVALSTLVHGWSARFGIAAQCAVLNEAARRLTPDAAANLYAITGEALHNVVKHSGATFVNVSLSRRGDRAVLLIEDDGRGFQASPKARNGRAFGLTTMRERAELAGGDFEIESAAGGTTVYVRVPFDCPDVGSVAG